MAGLKNVPNGYSALAEIYGRGANRTPLLVAFGFPLDWVVTLPSQDVNGEDGTIQVGEYAKGDTATFYVVPNESKVEVCYYCLFFCPLYLYINFISQILSHNNNRTFMIKISHSSNQP